VFKCTGYGHWLLKQGAKMADWRAEALLQPEATPSYAFARLPVAPCKHKQGVDNDRAPLGVCGRCSAERLRAEKRLDRPTASPSPLAPPAPHTSPLHTPQVARRLLPRPVLCSVSLPPPVVRGDSAFTLCSPPTLAVCIPPVGKQASPTSPLSPISTGAPPCEWF